MIPAAVLSLAAAGDVTLSASEDADGCFAASATYAYAGGRESVTWRAVSARDAADLAMHALSARCAQYATEALVAAEQATTLEAADRATHTHAVWRRRSAALRSLRVAALAAWSESDGAAEVAS